MKQSTLQPSILQSKAWQKFQQDLNETTFFEENNDYTILAIQKSTPVGPYLYLPYGPYLRQKSAAESAYKAVLALAQSQNAIFIRIEPQSRQNASYWLKRPNCRKSQDLNPAETWTIDLTGPDDALKTKLPSRLCRYHRGAAKKDLKIVTSHDPSDIKYLLDLQKSLAKDKGINVFPENYLKTQLAQPFATLYLLKQADEVLAAGLVFDDSTTRYNLQGAQSDTGRKLHATGILTIQLILDAKEKGLKTFDFWGIAPDGAPKSHPWAGFTAFKKTFAGTEVRYAGTHDLVLHPAKYRLYQILRKLNRLLRRG